jgi:hypothetical protein
MRGRHRTPSLMQIAAAIVGSAAATQVIRPVCRDPLCPNHERPINPGCLAEHAEAWRYGFPEATA